MSAIPRPAIAALVGGFALSSLHLCWVLVVASGCAQPLLDFIFRLHMLSSPFRVQPFSLGLSAALLLLTFLVGAGYGLLFHALRQAFRRRD